MPIAELGYRAWEGQRKSPLWRWLAITRAEVGIAMRRKLLRPFLFMAWMPLMWYGAIFFAIGYVADQANKLDDGVLVNIAREVLGEYLEPIRENPQVMLPAIWTFAFYLFFAFTQSVLAMAVVAMVGPPLISRDVRSKAFLLYFSKPMGAWEYLLGKGCAVLFFIFLITLVPALVLYAVSIALAPDIGTLQATAPLILRIFLASLMIGIPLSIVVLFISSLTKNARIVTFGWVALWIVGEIAYQSLAAGGQEHGAPGWAFMPSLRELSIVATSGVLDLQGQVDHLVEQFANRQLDVRVFDEFVEDVTHPGLLGGVEYSTFAIGLLVALSAVGGLVVMRRVTKPVRI